MYRASLPLIHASVAIRCQSQWEGPKGNKFELVSRLDSQISLAGGVLRWTSFYRYPVLATRFHYQGAKVRSLYSEVLCLVGFLYGEGQCIMGNGHMGPSWAQSDWQKDMTENIIFSQLCWRVVIIHKVGINVTVPQRTLDVQKFRRIMSETQLVPHYQQLFINSHFNCTQFVQCINSDVTKRLLIRCTGFHCSTTDGGYSLV